MTFRFAPFRQVLAVRNFPDDPSFALIICYVSSVARNCGCTRISRAGRSHALAYNTHTRAFARVYLVISILLSEQCICLRRRRVFDDVRAAAGAYNARADHYAFLFYAYVCISYAHAGGRTQNGTERNDGPSHRSRETGYKHLPIIAVFTAWARPRVHVLVGPLTSLTGEYRENLLPKVPLQAFMIPGAR